MPASDERSLEEKVREFILESTQPVRLAQIIQAFEGQYSHADIRDAFFEAAKTEGIEIERDPNFEL
jgi:hypothetical protein